MFVKIGLGYFGMSDMISYIFFPFFWILATFSDFSTMNIYDITFKSYPQNRYVQEIVLF